MMHAQDQPTWNQLAGQAVGMHVMFKSTCARNLVYLREDRS